MSVRERHSVKVFGQGPIDMLFAHGYGCDQHMWRLLTPAFEERYRIILYDLCGAGSSDLSAYSRDKYATLAGHAADVLEILEQVGSGPAVFVGHSVSAMVGMLAGIERPDKFLSHVMVGPSPCYINEGDYVGGFSQSDIDQLLDTLDSNYLGWASSMAPTIMGAPERPDLQEELTNSFCRTDPEIAKHFARVTFLSDNRTDVPKSQIKTLILQCSEDMIAPLTVGDYLAANLPNATLRLIDNFGHCPHLSNPGAIVAAMREFLFEGKTA
jgi:sigma-B regulation protein RsbQ